MDQTTSRFPTCGEHAGAACTATAAGGVAARPRSGRRRRRVLALTLTAALWAVFPVAATAAARSPSAQGATVQVQRWDLRDLYPDEAAWQTAMHAARERVDALSDLKDTVGRSAQDLYDGLRAVSTVQRETSRLGAWAMLKGDEDLRDAQAQERRQLVTALEARLGERTAWLAPAIQAMGAERVHGFLAELPELKARYDFFLDNTLRQAPHTLSPEGEQLLAGLGPVLGQPFRIFEQLGTAELQWPRVRLVGGPTVTMDTAAFEKHRSDPDRRRRKQVFDAHFGTLKQVEGSLGGILATQVLGDVYAARARRYDGALSAALFADDMPEAVYRTLVEQTHAALPTLHRYLRLRQRMLGVRGPLGYHDNYPPLVPEPKGLRFDLARSKAITLQALQPLGEEYLGLLRRGLNSAWTDSHPRPGKATGAYMLGSALDVHPYVLLNHNDDFESLSTLAHEWGHAVHTQLAAAAQPAEKADYSTFIAESASIGNEMLLMDHLAAHARNRQEKLYYLSQALETLRTTFFRQVMFAEFQLAMVQEVEQGRALSGARLSELYCGIARRYYGQAEGLMNIDPTYCIEWAEVSHFYYGFYVWQYATSIVGAAQLTQAIGSEGQAARDRFVNLLKAGGSEHPLQLYRKAGIDMASAQPYQALEARMNRLLDEFERLAPVAAAGH
jgi:oligoendopeptidase F